MTVREWLAGRTPRPPEGLAAWLAERSGPESGAGGAALTAALEARALAALDAARGAPGRNRDAAWELLGADALLTWAAEAALEEDDPEAALLGLLVRAAEPRR